MRHWIIFLLFPLVFCSSQPHEIQPISPKLKELSGLVFVNDSTLIAHNDGGNEPILYFLNRGGIIYHECFITNAKNIDWEDICFDGKDRIFIGDFGNNQNQRKDLHILEVSLTKAQISDSVSCVKHPFAYPDQQEFPPKPSGKYYDAEAMVYFANKVWVFTKNRTEPFDGLSKVYSIVCDGERTSCIEESPLQIGKVGWWKDAVTGADLVGNKCYLLTYDRVLIYGVEGSSLRFKSQHRIEPVTQKEAIAVDSKGAIIVGDEISKLWGGGFFTQINPAHP